MLFYFISYKKVIFLLRNKIRKKEKKLFVRKVIYGGESKKCRKFDAPKRQKQAKRNIDNPLILSISKNKIYPSIYIYHHIDTQPTESHLADRTPPPRLAITIHRTVLNNLFVTFFCLVNSLL